MDSEYLLELKQITKYFPGVHALNGVSFGIRAGEVRAILGENGAGKSTLMNILYGYYQPSKGHLYWKGQEVKIEDSLKAQQLGISMVHQEGMLLQQMDVTSNIFLSQMDATAGFIHAKRMQQKAKKALEALGISHISPNSMVYDLSAADQKMVEIAKALSMQPRLLLLDEPTASLTEREIKMLFQTIRLLKQEGVAILYISHRLEEIFQIADSVTILRDGQHKLGRVFLYLFAWLTSLFILYPYIVMFLGSLKDLQTMYRIPGTLLPEVWHWENYVNIWKDIPLLTYFKNSFIVAVFGTALCIVCAVPGAYALARMNFPGKKTLMSLIVMTQMFSPVVLMVGIYRAMSNFGLANSLVGIVLLVAAFNQAFAVWLLSGTFATISKELEEAARIDGCNKLSAMIRIILPLAAPGIVTAMTFVFIAGWNEYTLALILIGDSSLKTINLGIRAFFGYTGTEWWYVFAASILATLPILGFFRILERHLTGGLTAGGVKG